MGSPPLDYLWPRLIPSNSFKILEIPFELAVHFIPLGSGQLKCLKQGGHPASGNTWGAEECDGVAKECYSLQWSAVNWKMKWNECSDTSYDPSAVLRIVPACHSVGCVGYAAANYTLISENEKEKKHTHTNKNNNGCFYFNFHLTHIQYFVILTRFWKLFCSFL